MHRICFDQNNIRLNFSPSRVQIGKSFGTKQTFYFKRSKSTYSNKIGLPCYVELATLLFYWEMVPQSSMTRDFCCVCPSVCTCGYSSGPGIQAFTLCPLPVWIGILESLDPGPGLWTRKCWTGYITFLLRWYHKAVWQEIFVASAHLFALVDTLQARGFRHLLFVHYQSRFICLYDCNQDGCCGKSYITGDLLFDFACPVTVTSFQLLISTFCNGLTKWLDGRVKICHSLWYPRGMLFSRLPAKLQFQDKMRRRDPFFIQPPSVICRWD